MQIEHDQLLVIMCLLEKIFFRRRARSKLWF